MVGAELLLLPRQVFPLLGDFIVHRSILEHAAAHSTRTPQTLHDSSTKRSDNTSYADEFPALRNPGGLPMLRITRVTENKVHRQRLSTPPNLTDIHHSLSQTMEKKGEATEISWTAGERDFKLNIHCRLFEGEPRWQLTEVHTGYESIIWEYVSCDVLLIFNLIASATGQQELQMPTERTLGTKDALRDPTKAMSSYFLMPPSSDAETTCTSFSALVAEVSGNASIKESAPQPIARHAKKVDTQAIHSVMMCLRRFDTGMFTYAAFLYFLEQEYFRAYRTRGAFSVVLFSVKTKEWGNQRPANEVLRELAARISKVKRHNDVLAHYDYDDHYILLLPGTSVMGARRLVARLSSALKGLVLDMEISFGVAGVPEDCTDLGSLLGEAEYDKKVNNASKFEIAEKAS